MNRKNLIKIGIVICSLIGFACLWSLYGTHTVVLDEVTIQNQVNKQLNTEFPIKGAPGLLVKGVTVTAATVNVAEGRISSDITIQGRLVAGKKFVLNTTADGVPEFTSGAFYFRPQQVELKSLTYEGGSPAGLMSKFADRYITNEKAKLAINDSAPKIEGWVTGVAERAAVHSLQTRPIYRPGDDMKGTIIKASLKSVEVKGDKIHITFSLWKLTASVLIGILFVLAGVALMIALMINPPSWDLASALNWLS